MNKKILSLFIIISALVVTIIYPSLALAQGGLIPAPSGGGEGNYSLNDFVSVAISASQLILGLVGSLSLLMFVVGGIMFITSAGSSDKIGQAKRIMIASVVGLIIVFSSWLIIRFAVSSLGVSGNFQFDGNIKNIPSSF